jgi:transcriptional regulator GlxA family with amidase domain
MIEFSFPVRTLSLANQREHWAVRAERGNVEKRKVQVAFRNALKATPIKPVLRIVLTRVGPKRLDPDNLCGALKAIQDQVAAQLRIDDGSLLLKWEYEQEQGEYAVKVRVEGV